MGRLNIAPLEEGKSCKQPHMARSNMNRKISVLSLLLVVLLLYVIVAMIKGYYPMPFRKLYYVVQFDRGIPASGPDNIIDPNFMFFEEGYSINKEIKELSSLSHILVLSFQKPHTSIPLDSRFHGKLRIDIYRKEKLVFTGTISNALNKYEYDNQGRASKLYAYELLAIPFPLKGKAFKNINVQVTVLEADKELLNYIDSAILSVVPDLRL